jgi:hypothetical protein
MADPKAEEFEANERIAGFSLLSIKHARTMVRIMEDRDDIAHVARSLGRRSSGFPPMIDHERRPDAHPVG